MARLSNVKRREEPDVMDYRLPGGLSWDEWS
jgi:hypothetical protein